MPKTKAGKPSTPRKTSSSTLDLYNLLKIPTEKVNVQFVRELLSQGADKNYIDSQGLSPLHLASKNGLTEVAILLCIYSAEVNAKDCIQQWTPLHYACDEGYDEIVRVLVEHGADPLVRDTNGLTPLHWAARRGREEVCEFLLSLKNDQQKPRVDVNIQDEYGVTALSFACIKGHFKVADILLKRNADVNLCNRNGTSPLHFAANEGHTDLVRHLIEHKAKINADNKEQQTPLHYACAQGHLDVATLLLQKGAALRAQDKNGNVPLDKAPENFIKKLKDKIPDKFDPQIFADNANKGASISSGGSDGEKASVSETNDEQPASSPEPDRKEKRKTELLAWEKKIAVEQQKVNRKTQPQASPVGSPTAANNIKGTRRPLPALVDLKPPQRDEEDDEEEEEESISQPREQQEPEDPDDPDLELSPENKGDKNNNNNEDKDENKSGENDDQQKQDKTKPIKKKNPLTGKTETQAAASILSDVWSSMNSGTEWEIDIKEIKFGPQIGRGGCGEVSKAVWRGTEVAVKKLYTQRMKDKDLKEFRAEIQMMSKLRHPNVVLFMGACTNPPNLCIVTEYLPRGSLWHILHDRSVNISWKLIIKMATDAARGMYYLHCFKPIIMHRDLKSPNLLVDQNWNVKVCDFGFTKVKEENFANTRCGTPQWMAPEVLRAEEYDEKADIYSFGIVLWELFTRQTPYAKLSAMEVGKKVLTENLRPPIPKNCPPDFAKLMQECWSETPAKRPTFGKILQVLTGLS
jgi:ankyrin repeat protein